MTDRVCPHCGRPHPPRANVCPVTGRPLPRHGGGRSPYFILGAIGLALMGAGGWVLIGERLPVPAAPVASPTQVEPAPADQVVPPPPLPSPLLLPTDPPPTVAPTRAPEDTLASIPDSPLVRDVEFGRSVQGTPLRARQIGDGPRHIVLVGGLHAGFAPGTEDLAYRAIDYFTEHPDEVPASATLHLIASANPDSPPAPGERRGRLNANGVDLNRNWDCQWTSDAVWRNQPVSGGKAPLSEPESRALHDYLWEIRPVAVVFWEAKATGGMASPGGCGPASLVSEPLAATYGVAAGYSVEPFEVYAVTGDAVNWLDSQRIPAISVLLPDYTLTDWADNLRGIRAVLHEFGR